MIPESASSFARRRPVPLRAAARLPHWLQAHSLRSLAKRLRKTQLPSRARGPSSNLPQRQPQRPILLSAHLPRRFELAKILRGRFRQRREPELIPCWQLLPRRSLPPRLPARRLRSSELELEPQLPSHQQNRCARFRLPLWPLRPVPSPVQASAPIPPAPLQPTRRSTAVRSFRRRQQRNSLPQELLDPI